MKLNCLLLAGTKGCKQFTVGKRQLYKQYLPLGNKMLIEYVIDALLQATTLKNIFIVGDVQELQKIVRVKYTQAYNQRLFLVEHGENVIDGILGAFFHAVLPHEGYPEFNGDYIKNEDIEQYRLHNPKAENEKVLMVFSDIPFLSPKDVDYFVETSKLDYDYVYGLSTEKAIQALMKKIRATIDVHILKLGTFPVYREAIRHNNLQMLKPLRVNPQLYQLALAIYRNRMLLTPTGKEYRTSWTNITKAFLQYTLGKGYRYKVVKGIVQAFWYGSIVYLAHKLRNNHFGKILRWYLKPKVFEKVCSNLSGGQTRATVNISNIITAVMDIDGEEMYHFLTKDNCRTFKQISKYTYR